jgi:Tfp pilus assembly protein PilN
MLKSKSIACTLAKRMKTKLFYGSLIALWIVVSGWLIIAKATAEEQRFLRRHIEQNAWVLNKLSRRIENMPAGSIKDTLSAQIAGQLRFINHESEELNRRSPSSFWMLMTQLAMQSIPIIVLVPAMLKRRRNKGSPSKGVHDSLANSAS